MIEVKNIMMKYDDVVVLKLENYVFSKGKAYALIGENGSGKSTLLKILADVIKPTQGAVIKDKTLKVGYLPQKSYPFNMSVYNNLAFSQEIKNKDKIFETLEEYDLMNFKRKNARKLSGGETQRLCLARLLQNKYDILLLDEFTAAVDKENQEFFNLKVKEYIKKNDTILIFASHNDLQVKELADIVLTFKRGELTI